MFSFLRVAMVMVSLHSNRTPSKTTFLTLIAFGRMFYHSKRVRLKLHTQDHSPGCTVVLQGWLPGPGQRLAHTTGQRNSRLVKSVSRRIVIKTLRELHVPEWMDSKHFQGKSAESMLLYFGPSLSRNTVRRTRE